MSVRFAVLLACSAFAFSSVSSAAELNAFEANSEKFAEAFPLQYDSYVKSLKTSEEPDRFKTPVDPMHSIIYGKLYNYRNMVEGKRSHANSMLEAYWSMGASKEGFQRCLPCHSADTPRLLDKYGEKGFYEGKFDAMAEGLNPVGCANCHNTQTWQLRVFAPHARESIAKIGKDPDKLSHVDAKTYICTQCHFEYDKVKKDGIVFLESDWTLYGNIDRLAKYYDEDMKPNLVHPLSRAPLVRPMNNEAGMAMQGQHVKHGVACADCHLPKTKDAKTGDRYTEHDLIEGSRMLEDSCMACHTESDRKTVEADLKARTAEYRGPRMQALGRELANAHLLIQKGLKAGAAPAEFESVYASLRKAQWRWDYTMWLKGGAFHSSFNVQKLLADGFDHVTTATHGIYEVLARHNVKDVSVPDYSTAEAAAKILGVAYPAPEPDRIDYKNVFEAIDAHGHDMNSEIMRHTLEILKKEGKH